MDNVCKVVYFKVGKEPEEGEMVNSVEGMREAIGGGYAEAINLNGNMVILCDDEGLIKELPYNRGLRGDWLIVGSSGDEFISLTDEQVKWIKRNVEHVGVWRIKNERT